MIVALPDLREGRSGQLVDVRGSGSHRRRLLEMGFLPGTVVRLVRRLVPEGVLEVEVRDTRISLRIAEAGVLVVETVA